MASTIQALPTEVVYLITAGEVIDSLASVVRELAENSLDAGATRIVVSVWPQQWRVRVADNGCGMNKNDLQQAALAYSTSKIRSSEDLWKINSLGFRGEALHSLTTLADLEILSRPRTENVGWRVVYGDDGKAVELEATAIAPGTVVTVSHLFGNCVMRRQGLPTTAQQIRSIQVAIQQIALCHPHITWQVWQNDRQWFTISPAATTAQILPQILPQVRQGDLQELKLEIPNPASSEIPTGKSAITLLVGLPDRCHRRRPDWVRVAINGRMVKSPELEQTILSAFHKTLPRDRYPICLLKLALSPEQINWNRNPAKNEIYLHEISYWQEQITQAINQALRISAVHLQESVHTTRVSKLLKSAETKADYYPNTQNSHAENTTQHSLKAIAQLSNTYIVVEHLGGMWLVEQHIAHERVLYEQISDNWQLVPVEPAIILYQLSPVQVSQLQRIGVDIEPFGEQIWAIRTVPALLQRREDCAEAILELSWGGDLQAAQVAVACRSAIRNGTPMNLAEMQTLLDQWQRTRNPRTCPHGRPIYLSLEEPALARFFRRNWVIGKSHGI
ncbi:DNA mismatch repair endonuclease MutL [Umezakia ovalisporum]|jgi:DNA mismatch repair protein MutL|uniref:DNA mismatch repair protein MutL n=2 Tax=Umezakia ovalisporum TaxID=75695 RepID=A0AA43H147_9CYAN|nr:DNA mismatch repair endonuclease MutL [Umezakia ovalisporum]MBI1241187.1 DNA mismatch repair endonuclease MutL [Nostoc sp. RI_552]MDH6057743.1 DNA mismatch repair endonuclease MutL [Umezakia ovalisporum FSS-43]MDH6064775.1 DNA mismatch repair endonuclease MutL [Umezakia ovalisporum FSS-62]MDH6067375.1 DNA mismatch repair endonuclease MutL [Umezakia ovalisporum APH033B]MDH6070330.1 DNA mismatch repair endonuclease MutL [Umezakia ovalisporum CobakiLakeA]